MSKSTLAFQAETKELLDLMIHSLYSKREIFLRELISNASDAIEKFRIESLTKEALKQLVSEPEIRLSTDPSLHLLSITDNGIGMSKEEVTENIGTIARSGTKSYLKAREAAKNEPDLIGQFGVGFYSAFMVADRVVLHTQKAGESTGTLWESDGSGTYTIEEKSRSEGHGTTITLHLKSTSADNEQAQEESTQDFTDFYTLSELVKKYSDFVTFPIKLSQTKEEEKDGKKELVVTDHVLNSRKALWLKSPSEVTTEEYNEFYKHLSHDWSPPLKTTHFKVEGTLEFGAILFIPSQKPYSYDFKEYKTSLSLYVKRVFIKGDCEELLPAYLRFISGVVDCDDLSLNVSREILQQDRQIVKIRKALTSKVLNTLRDLLEKNRTEYETFWNSFGSTLKEGIALEPTSSEKLRDLALFHSDFSANLTSLKEYLGRMKPDQKAIYFMTGDSLQQLKNSPYLEKLKRKGYEVLLLIDRVDSWVTQAMPNYEGKPLQSVTGENLDIATEEEKKTEQEDTQQARSTLQPLMDIMSHALSDRVKEIKLSERLIDSPVCLVSSGNSTSAHMERLMESMGQPVPKAKRVMEINAKHPLYTTMLKLPKTEQEEWSDILYQQALLNEGSQVENPLEYSRKIADLMVQAYQAKNP
jgi:molecular chaperone HtpG